MTDALVFISGASRGIGRALARAVPFPAVRVVDISRSGPGDLTVAGRAVEHLPADLASPDGWRRVADAFAGEAAGFSGDRLVFVHNAGTLSPVGFAGEVEAHAYRRNVMLNSAAPQVLGAAFLGAVGGLACRRDLLVISSGAATSAYEGWSAYGAGKAAVDQWVRAVGREQERRGGVRVAAIAPGVVATDMQAEIRTQDPRDFPAVERFVGLHEEGRLRDPAEVAEQFWQVVEDGLPNGAVVDLRDR